MSLHLTQRALHDIQDIYDYSVSKWGNKVAEEYLDKMEETLSLLKSYTNLLTTKPQISEHFLAYQSGSHWLVCDMTDHDVFVLTVQHVSMDLLENIKELEPTLEKEMEILHQEIEKG